MANTFRRLRKQGISASLSRVANYAANTATTVILIGATACNTTQNAVTVDFATYDGSTTVYLAKNVPIPVGGTLVISDSQKTVLMAGDYFQTTASANSAIDVVISVLEIT